MPDWAFALGLVYWTRLDGVISLELGHHLASTGIDPALLYESEIQSLAGQVATLTASPP